MRDGIRTGRGRRYRLINRLSFVWRLARGGLRLQDSGRRLWTIDGWRNRPRALPVSRRLLRNALHLGLKQALLPNVAFRLRERCLLRLNLWRKGHPSIHERRAPPIVKRTLSLERLS